MTPVRSFWRGFVVRFAGFAGAGALGTVVHYAVLAGLVELLGVGPTVATCFGALCGALVNYVLNYRFTFRSAESHRVTLPKFMAIAAAGLGISALVVSFAGHHGVHYAAAQVFATGLVLLFGFVANHFWTFARSSRQRT